MIDQAKIDVKIIELNGESAALHKSLSASSSKPDTWDEVEGTLALMMVDYHNKSNANFYQNSGVILKGFINTRTKEIKIFPISEFEKFSNLSGFPL